MLVWLEWPTFCDNYLFYEFFNNYYDSGNALGIGGKILNK